MTRATRDVWLLIAGLPGVVVPFVPLFNFFSDLTPLELLTWPDSLALVTLPAFVPWFVVTWQLHRLVSDRENVAWRAVAWVVAVVATVAAVLWTPLNGLPPDLALHSPIVANLALLLYVSRRGRSSDVIAETFLLGTYVATAAPWIILIIGEHGDRIGAWLAAWTCIVYAATIVFRLRTPHRNS